MTWLIVTILAYLFLAVVSLFDRYFLVGSIPNPKAYTFYVGILWFFLCLFLIPFGVFFPGSDIMFLGLASGIIRIFAVLFLAKSIVGSEISRAVPAIGGFLPFFSFFLFFLFSPQKEILNFSQVLAFILLVLGSVLISLKEPSLRFFSFKNLKYPLFSSFLFAFSYFLSKVLFLKTTFLNGGFLILLGGGLGAASFLILSQTRKSVLSQRPTQKISWIFLLGQIFGGIGTIALYYAVFLAKSSQIPLINALEGTRFVFLLIFVLILSLWKPNLLKEEISNKTLFQKVIAILLIGGGLALLTL